MGDEKVRQCDRLRWKETEVDRVKTFNGKGPDEEEEQGPNIYI